MRLTYVGAMLAALVTLGCPFPDRTLGNGGFAFGGGGANGTGPDALAFTVQPSTANAGDIITPGIQVTVRDSLGRPDSAFAANVTIAIAANPVGGTLSGTRSVAPANGVALFGDLSISRSSAGYTLLATAPGATSATSNSFTILVAP